MERTPSKERVIPIEVIGSIADVSEEEIDIDNFVENINSKINVSKLPKSPSNPDKPTSNRGSLIITHEDGTTEENECTVTCLGVSSDSVGSLGLQIEEISQDTLKGKLTDDKLKVVIPDVSQVIILESDEVTDASFVSTPEVEDGGCLSQPYVNNILEDAYTPLSTTPTIVCTMAHEVGFEVDCEEVEDSSTPILMTTTVGFEMAHEGQENTTQQLQEGITNHQNKVETENNFHVSILSKEQESVIEETKLIASESKELINKKDVQAGANFESTFSLKEEENTINPKNVENGESLCEIPAAVESLTPEIETVSVVLQGEVSKLIVEPEIIEVLTVLPIQIQCENTAEEEGQQPIKINRKSFGEDLEFFESKEDGSVVIQDLQSVQVEKKEIREVQINLDDETKNTRTNSISMQDSKETANPENIRKSDEPINREDLILESESQQMQQISLDNVENQNKLPRLNAIAEAVRIIPIALPDGKFVEKGSLQNDCVQSESNEKLINKDTTQVPDAKSKIKETMNINYVNKDGGVLTRTIPIQFESQEMLSTSKQERKKDDKNGNIAEEKEEMPNNASSGNLVGSFSQNMTIKSSQPIKKLSEISNNKICTEQITQKVESKNFMDSASNIVMSNFEQKVSSRGASQTNNEKPIEDKQQQSKDEIPSELFHRDMVKERRVSIQRPNSSSSEGELSNTIINTQDIVKDDYESLDQNKQTEETGIRNTCSVTSSGQLSQSKEVENNEVRNIPIQIQTNLEGESENSHENESRNYKQTSKDKETDEACEYEGSSMRKHSSISTESSTQFTKGSSEEVKYQNDNDQVTNSSRPITKPLVRTVPIEILGYSAEHSEKQENNTNEAFKEATKQSNPHQIGRSIPIQRVLEKDDNESTNISRNSKIADKMHNSVNYEDPKTASPITGDTQTIKQKKEIQTQSNLQQHASQTKPPQGSISVPIQIQLSSEIPDETIKSPINKETNIENKVKDTQCQIDQETPASTNIKVTSGDKLQHEKESCPNPFKFNTLPSVPTSKPPAAIRTIPILRQSLSDSGAGMARQQSSARQRNASDQSRRGDILQKVHADLEEARVKLTAQANSLSSGLENISKPDPRSRSVESEQRYQGAKLKDNNPRKMFKRERSLQDIDKDIETIWRELQELDKPNMGNENNIQRSSRNNNRPPSAPVPLSEQVLVTPSWRTPTPPPPSSSVRTSLSNPNISNTNASRQSLPQTTAPHTIWDTPETQGPKYEPTPVSQLSSSWDSKPQYFPTKPSTHFSFLPKAETKPGAITPSYVSQSPKVARPPFRNIPIQKSEPSVPMETDFPLHTENEPQRIPTESKQEVIQSKVFKSEESLKSCLKSETSAFTFQPLKNRSQSPSNVKFSTKMRVKPKSNENVPKTCEQSSEPDPPFEWVDFRKADGEIVKGTILPPLHRENDVIISRDVPIINVLLDDAMKEDPKMKTNNMKPTIKEKEIKIQSPTQIENKPSKDDNNSDVFNACDAGTQTEKSDKKGGCLLM